MPIKLLNRIVFPLSICLASIQGLYAVTPQEGGTAETILIDVRTKEEFQSGHLKNAINLPVDEISETIEKIVPNKNTNIELYCRSGRRSGIAKEKLEAKGYTNVKNLGGYEALKASGK